MKLTIEITNPDDLLFVRTLLNGYGVDQPVPVPENEPVVAEAEVRKETASRGRKKANGAAEPVAEAEAATPEPDAPVQDETQPEPPLEAVENPFADEVKPKKTKKLTREDVNAAFTGYIHTYGQTAAMVDVVKLLTENFKVTKLSALPNTQEAYARAIDLVATAIDENTFMRERI